MSSLIKKGENNALKPRKKKDYAEHMRRYRARNGGRNLQMTLKVDEAACILYLKQQWGFDSYAETVRVSLLHLTRLTRLGLNKLEIGFKPIEIDCDEEMPEDGVN